MHPDDKVIVCNMMKTIGTLILVGIILIFVSASFA